MGLELKRPELTELKPRITVIGVGGAGGNAVANMIEAGVQGVDFVVANTDAQALASATAETRIQLGLKITQGLGAGSRPEIGRAAAEETIDDIEAALDGCHMCFITAGMGGGTGTGAAPVVARAAREKGILTVGVVTKPFSFEGARRMRSAEAGIAELQQQVDTLIIIPNQNLFLIANANTTFKEAFTMADQVLNQGVRGITDLMVMPGLINLDFADIRTVMSEMGKAMMGTGEAEGDNRAIEAAAKAISNPLLDEVSMRGAKGVIINITGGDDLRLMEVDEAANHIREMVDPDANIIWGSAFNPDLAGKMRVSVVATGIDAAARAEASATMAQPSVSLGSVPATLGAAPTSHIVRATQQPKPETAATGQSIAQPPATQPGAGAAQTAVAATAADPTPAAQPVAAAPITGARAADPGEPAADAAAEPELALAPSDIIADDEGEVPTVAAAADAGQPAPSNVRPLRTEGPVEAPSPAATRRQAPAGERPPQTLFERMKNLHRVPKREAGEADSQDAEDPFAIPPMFRRQVND